ncbi:MAG: glycosyltransferase family A protein [Chloroflexota bacterium]
MFCSVIIPSVGRQSLSRAVHSVLAQKSLPGQVEVIIVNDSGDVHAVAEWAERDDVRIMHTNRRERCLARNTGAAVAKGRYLWFLDDDDWILPGAINEFQTLASRSPGAYWLYGGIHIVNEDGIVLAERNSGLNGRCSAQMIGGAWAPIQSSMIRTDAFFEAGGFNPQIIGTEDLDLCRRIALIGEFANTEAAVACLLRGNLWSTSTNYSRAPSDTRRSRDALLDEPGVYSLLRESADNPYWLGRIVRVYLSTINWNLKQGRFFKVLSRSLYTIVGILDAGGAIFTKTFWAGVRAEHVPGTLHFVMKNLENEVMTQSHNKSS